MKFKNLNNFIMEIPANYLAEMAKKNVAFVGNCKDLYTYFQKINKNCEHFSITKQNWKSVVKSLTKKDKNNMPKFDVIVGNPPYEGKGNPLYLKILEKVNVNNNRVIWLCPSQWTINIEDSDYISKLKTGTCKNLVYHKNVGNPFDDAGLGNDVCIYVFGENTNYENYEDLKNEKHTNKKIAISIIEKFKNNDNLNKHTFSNTKTAEYENKYCVNAGYVRGHFIDTGKYKWDWTTLFSSEYRNEFKFVHIVNGHHWYFNTKKECVNFVAACETDIISYGMLVSKITTNNTGIVLKYMPWLGDYTHEWTEKEIAKKLNLTKEEVEYIHKEMANFGWKAAPRKTKPETKDKMNVSMKAQTKVQKLEVITKEQIKKLQIKGLNLVTQIKKKNVAEFGRAYGVEWRKINKKFSDNQTLRSYNYAKARIAVAKKFV